MSRIGSILSRGVSHLSAALENPRLTWSGTEYNCVPHQTDEGKAMEAGGLVPSGGQSFVLLLSELGTARPAAMEFVTYSGTSFQIERVKVSPDGSHIVLQCVEPDRGA
jgi:hypothetical protein